MGFWFEQSYNIALGIVLAIAGAALLGLVNHIGKQMPPRGPYWNRVRAGARRAPVAASFVAIVLVLCLSVVCVRLAVGNPVEGTASPPPPSESARPPAPEPTPSQTGLDLTLAGWGPGDRDLIQASDRPSEPALNSIIDHPERGDERNFLMAKSLADTESTYQDVLVVTPGTNYRFAVRPANDAATSDAAARGVRMRVQMPAIAAGSAPAYVFVSSTNSQPAEVWDGVTLVGEDPSAQFALRYVKDSAQLHTPDGTVSLSDQIFTEGTEIGCKQLDGVLPGGDACDSYVTFDVRVDQPNFTATVVAGSLDSNSWSQTAIASPGQRMTVWAAYQNTGTTQQNDVVLRVNLPANAHYVHGTARWKPGTEEYKEVIGDITGDGINIGSYSPGATADVLLDVIVDSAPGTAPMRQRIGDMFVVVTKNGSKSASLTLAWLR